MVIACAITRREGVGYTAKDSTIIVGTGSDGLAAHRGGDTLCTIGNGFNIHAGWKGMQGLRQLAARLRTVVDTDELYFVVLVNDSQGCFVAGRQRDKDSANDGEGRKHPNDPLA
jgi:hypothetical protein